MALFRANSFVFRPSERTLAQNPRSKLINNEIYNFVRLAKTHLRKLTGKIFRTIISTSRFLIDIFVFPFPPLPLLFVPRLVRLRQFCSSYTLAWRGVQ